MLTQTQPCLNSAPSITSQRENSLFITAGLLRSASYPSSPMYPTYFHPLPLTAKSQVAESQEIRTETTPNDWMWLVIFSSDYSSFYLTLSAGHRDPEHGCADWKEGGDACEDSSCGGRWSNHRCIRLHRLQHQWWRCSQGRISSSSFVKFVHKQRTKRAKSFRFKKKTSCLFTQWWKRCWVLVERDWVIRKVKMDWNARLYLHRTLFSFNHFICFSSVVKNIFTD